MKQIAVTLTYADLLEGTVRHIIPRDFHFHILTSHLMFAMQTMQLPYPPKCASLAMFYRSADLTPYAPFEIESRGSIVGIALDKHPELALQLFEGRVFVLDFPKDLHRVIQDLEARAGDFKVVFDPAAEPQSVPATLAHFKGVVTLYFGK